jgi:hypothetical protein
MRLLPEGALPWYRRRLTPLQHAGLLIMTLGCGAGVAAVLLIHRAELGRLAERYPSGSTLATLALSLLQVACAWLIAGQATRARPYAGLFMAGCGALGMSYGNAPAFWGVALLVIALAARPRPHRRAIRTCIALLACVLLALAGSHVLGTDAARSSMG